MQAEQFALAIYWPKNDAACFNCQFKQVCDKDPDSRERWLEADYYRSAWNPAEERR